MRETLELLEDLLSEKVINVLGREIELPDGVTDREVVDHLLTIAPKGDTPGTAGARAAIFNPIKWARSNGIERITAFASDGIGFNAIRIIKNKNLLQILPDNQPLKLPRDGTYSWSQFTKKTPGFRDLVVGNEQEGPVSTQSMSDPVGKGEIALCFLFGLTKGSGDTDLKSPDGGSGYSVKYMGPRGDDPTNLSEGSTAKVLNIASRILFANDSVKRNEFLKLVSDKPEVSFKSISEFDPRAIEAINSALGSISLKLLVTFDGGFRICDHLDSKFEVITKGRIKIRQREANEDRSVAPDASAIEEYNKEVNPVQADDASTGAGADADADADAGADAGADESGVKKKEKKEKKERSPYDPIRVIDPSSLDLNATGIGILYDALGLPTQSRPKPTATAQIIQDFSDWLDSVETKKRAGGQPVTINKTYRTERAPRAVIAFLRSVETFLSTTRPDVPLAEFIDSKNAIKDWFTDAMNSQSMTTWRSTGRYAPSPGTSTDGARMFNNLLDISATGISEASIEKFINDHLSNQEISKFEDFKGAVADLARQQEDMGSPVLTDVSDQLNAEYSSVLDQAKQNRANLVQARKPVPQKRDQGLIQGLEEEFAGLIEKLRSLAKAAMMSSIVENSGRQRPGKLVSETLTLLEDLLSP